jgi:hypothetical protein
MRASTHSRNPDFPACCKFAGSAPYAELSLRVFSCSCEARQWGQTWFQEKSCMSWSGPCRWSKWARGSKSRVATWLGFARRYACRVRSEANGLSSQSGRHPERPSLPDAQPGDQLSWSQDGGLHAPPRLNVSAPPRPARRELPRVVTGVHGLIRDAKEHYDDGYKVVLPRAESAPTRS